MKITECGLFGFQLPLKKPISTVHADHTFREGLLVELKNESGHMAYGEASPLPDFSPEDLTQARKELLGVKSALIGSEVPSGLDSLESGFESWPAGPSLCSSARLAVESAVMELIAAERKLPLATILGAGSLHDVKVSALLTGSSEEVLSKAAAAVADGFMSVKLKIGHLPFDGVVRLVGAVRNEIGERVALRLDANRAYVVNEALELVGRLRGFDIDYIEEPVRNLNQLRRFLGQTKKTVPIALDESLLEIKPEDLALCYPIKAIVIKPTLLGLERAFRFALNARANDISVVTSSSYESSVGMRVLSAFAAATAGDIPAGLDTLDIFSDDLVKDPVRVTSGRINARYLREPAPDIRFELLEEIVSD